MNLHRLPKSPAKAALISGKYPQLISALQRLNIEAIPTTQDFRLPEPVSWHPDMQACPLGKITYVLRQSPLEGALRRCCGVIRETGKVPGKVYPQDALCNVLAWSGYVLGNRKTADPQLVSAADELGKIWIPVHQGYSACSTALVDENSAITADQGIARQLEKAGMQVLQITPGGIALPGYNTGFFGGCCGKLAPDIMAFAGELDSHSDGQEIRKFLTARGVKGIELQKGQLLDVGGIMAIC